MPATAPSPISVPQPHDDRTSSISRFANSPVDSPASAVSAWSEGRRPNAKWRHTLGIILLLVTVVLWTASNFLASTIFADDTYSKPYFVTYVNTSFFILPIIPMALKYSWEERGKVTDWRSLLKRKVGKYTVLTQDEEEDEFIKRTERGSGSGASLRNGESGQMLLAEDMAASQEISAVGSVGGSRGEVPEHEPMTVYETAKLSIEFCIPWFLANYFTAACLEYTTVASSTILASTSSIWTLLFGSIIGVERFTLRKLLGVLSSLAGIGLISLVDVSGENDENRGDFPHKSREELILGDSMAVLGAVLYGGYVILMKKRIGDEARVNMPLFFAFIGMFNIILLWPGFVILHLIGVEKFELPPTSWVIMIILVNSASSLVADIVWAFAMLLTSPLVVTVGLSMTIPLSLIGQMVLDSQYSSPLYWVGACVVFLSFLFINHEEKKDDGGATELSNSRIEERED